MKVTALEIAAPESQSLHPGWKFVAAFTAVYLTIAIPSAIQNSTEFLIYCSEVILLSLALAYVHSRFHFHLASLWCLSFWGLAHLSGGLVHVPEDWNTLGSNLLYNLWLIPGCLKYDQAVHFYGYAILTWVNWQILRQVTNVSAPTFELTIIMVATTMGVGSLNEVVEFLASLVLPNNNVGDYTNYGWDLVSNSLGSILAATIIVLTTRKNTSHQ